MKVRILRAADYPVSRWAGGTTAQIYLYPEDGDYSRRNFIFRLSSAVIQCPQSDFTPLPGVQRHIMMLEGAARLVYQGRGETTLTPYEAETFDGGWQTTSFGCGTDFNLMLRQGAAGGLWAQALAPGERFALKCEAGCFALAFAAQGEALSAGGQALGPRDSLLLEGEGQAILQNGGESPARLACAWARLP
jgi:environmental stress-induced protein Ves